MHLIVDGYVKTPDILWDEAFLYQLLDSYPAQIGMSKISEPFVVRYEGGEAEDRGISGFVFIAESHISVHTFAERGYVNIDVFSCRDFDVERAIKDIQDKFQLIKLRSYLVNRNWEVAPVKPTPEK